MRCAADAPTVEFVSDVITRAGEPLELSFSDMIPEGYLHAAHLDRRGRWVSRAVVGGFAPDLGGFATTATSSEYILALGREPEAMALAAARMRELGGGAVFAEGGCVVWETALPLAGIMSDGEFSEAAEFAAGIKSVLHRAGCPHGDPLYSLLFLTADFLPGPRFTVSGVLDAASGRMISHAEPVAPEDG